MTPALVAMKRQMTSTEAKRLEGARVAEWGPSCESPCDVVDADTGEPVAYVRRAPEIVLPALRQAMLTYPMTTTLRAAGIRNRSCVFGFTSRNQVLRREGCRSCGGATEAPREHETIAGASIWLSKMLSDAAPDMSYTDHVRAQAVAPEWRMGQTQWTSGVLNETSALPYHYDGNNMATWNAMLVIRRGTRGGHFHVPEYGLTLPCRDGDVCFFPAYRTLHGVTPIRKVADDGYRYSAVYYTVARMAACLSPDEELAYAQRTRSEREDTLLDRQRESGLLAAPE